MRIKLDENLGRPHVALLKRQKYDADRVFDQGLSGIEDAELWVRVRRDLVNFSSPWIWDSLTFAVMLPAHIQEYCSCARVEKGGKRYHTFCGVS